MLPVCLHYISICTVGSQFNVEQHEKEATSTYKAASFKILNETFRLLCTSDKEKC